MWSELSCALFTEFFDDGGRGRLLATNRSISPRSHESCNQMLSSNLVPHHLFNNFSERNFQQRIEESHSPCPPLFEVSTLFIPFLSNSTSWSDDQLLNFSHPMFPEYLPHWGNTSPCIPVLASLAWFLQIHTRSTTLLFNYYFSLLGFPFGRRLASQFISFYRFCPCRFPCHRLSATLRAALGHSPPFPSWLVDAFFLSPPMTLCTRSIRIYSQTLIPSQSEPVKTSTVCSAF